MSQLIVTVPGRPFSLNAERSEHWHNIAEMKKLTRLAAKTMALHEMPWPRSRPLFEQVRITVEPWAKDRRYRQDVGNCYPTAKACVDGLVDAHVIEDDSPDYLLELTFRPHQFGLDQMVLIVDEIIQVSTVTDIELGRLLHAKKQREGVRP